ncbi:hypothetical protein [Lactobacillus crispatus]|uniref:aggregation-promoting factor n=1 Tax=Lactobacillus crispatus TaxID=47770 RepID=UPI003F27683B
MKTKSILTKTIAVAALSLAGIGAINQLDNNEAQAAVVQSDAVVYTTTQATTVYNNYENPVATGQTLAAGTNWKIIKTAYDSKGQKWYDLGLNQWVLATNYTTSQNTQARQENIYTQTQTPAQQTTQVSQSQSSYTYSNVNYTPKTTTTSSYSSTATGSEASAKAWIASKESGGSYSARNGEYVGKYQLSSSYLNSDYSAANQERVADNYVKSRYGSWSAAKNFWQANGWY